MTYQQQLLNRVRAGIVIRRVRAYGLSDEAPEWWGELHDKAAAHLTDRGRYPAEITDSPEILRDFLRIGLVVQRHAPGVGHPPVVYRLARPGDRLHNSALEARQWSE